MNESKLSLLRDVDYGAVAREVSTKLWLLRALVLHQEEGPDGEEMATQMILPALGALKEFCDCFECDWVELEKEMRKEAEAVVGAIPQSEICNPQSEGGVL